MSHSNMYGIKHYENDQWVNTLRELRAVLRKHYRGTSVTLFLPQPSGINRMVFVDIDAVGDVWCSYGAKEAFDWSMLKCREALSNPLEKGYLAKGRYPVQVLRNAAGYYIGTLDEQGMPYSRESVEYYPTEELADDAWRNRTWTQRLKP